MMSILAIRLYYVALTLLMLIASMMVVQRAEARGWNSGLKPAVNTTHNYKRHRNRHARTKIPGWYFSASGSINFVTDGSLEETGGAARSGDLSYDEGYGFAGALGYRFKGSQGFNDYYRVELEGGLRVNKVESFKQSSGTLQTLDDHMNLTTFMANGYLDFDMGSGFRPYVGGGLGIAAVNLDSTFFGVDETEAVFAYQAMLGMFYQPWGLKNTDFGIGYRYLGTADPEFKDGSGTIIDTEYSAHMIELITRIRF